MATFREITTIVLDLLKEHSDDAFYTEEHVIFLASRMRAMLLDKKYKKSRNTPFSMVSPENMQEICLPLEVADTSGFGCTGVWLRTVNEVPAVMNIAEPFVAPSNILVGSQVSFIPAERMPYVGHNKWLKNFIYAALAGNNHIYLTAINPQFMFLEQIKMRGVFSNPEKSAELVCDGSGASCDIMDTYFPLEEGLLSTCIEMVVQELLGSRYAPEDKRNNGSDDLSDMNVAGTRASQPAVKAEQ